MYICKLPEEKNRTVLEKLLPIVSAQRQDRINKFVHINDAYRALTGDLLVRFILLKRYGSILKELEFDTNLYGKPFLCKYPFFHYNIAHSGEWIVCAVHDKKIGVDIEKILPFDLQVAKRLFTEEEYRDLLDDKKERNISFYDIWTLKESYVKAQGRGLSIPLDFFNVKKYNSDHIKLTDTNTRKTITNFTCKQYWINNKYSLSVCANHANINQFEKLPILVSFDKICNDLLTSL